MNEFEQKLDTVRELQEVLEIQQELDKQYNTFAQRLFNTLKIQNDLNMYKDSLLTKMLNFRKVVKLKFEDNINEYTIIEYEKLENQSNKTPILELIRQNYSPIECQFDDPNITPIEQETKSNITSKTKPNIELQTFNKLNTNCKNKTADNRKRTDDENDENNEKKNALVHHISHIADKTNHNTKYAKCTNRKYTPSQIALLNKKTKSGNRKHRHKNRKKNRKINNKRKIQTRIFSNQFEKASKNY